MSISAADMAALQGMYDSAGALQAKQISQQYKLGKADLAARLKIASQSSKDTRYGIDAERDTAREQIEQARQEMERIGIPDMEIRRFVAETTAELARQELDLKREQFLAESGLARDQLNKDIREMEEIGIPRVQIERYVAEKQAAIAEQEQALKERQFSEDQRQFNTTFGEGQRQFNTTFGEGQRQFNTTASGYMQTPGRLDTQQQERYNQLTGWDQTIKAQGGAGISAAEQVELQGLQDVLSGRAGPQQTTLEREAFQQTQLEQARRYGLDVSKFGAELASTPDTYFAGRRFQGVDIPRLMGGAGAPTSAPSGSPVPGVARMGAYLSGQDPFATPYGGPQAGAPQPSAPGTLGLPGTPEDDRQKQVAKLASISPPSPFDGLDEQDTATLRLMQSIYQKGGQSVAGGEYERLAASGRLGYLQSAGKVLGFDPKQFESDYLSYRPSQGSSSAAG